jgi:hypothetical protein
VFPVDSYGTASHEVLSSTDATPIYISGWLIDAERTICYGVVLGDGCTDFVLHPAPGGGEPMVIYRPVSFTIPDVTPLYARRVVVRVHTHDAACHDAECAQTPVLDGLVEVDDQQAIVLPDPASAPVGISRESAIRAALNTTGGSTQGQLVVSAHLGIVGTNAPNWPDVDATRYAWDVELRPSSIVDTPHGMRVFVDNETGDVLDETVNLEAAPAVLPGPTTAVPADLVGVPVYQGDLARAEFSAGLPASILVGGWLQGVDRAVCNPSNTATGASAGSPCEGLWLHPGPDGGNPIAMATSDAGLPAVIVPPEGVSVPAVVRVHLEVRDLPGGGTTFDPVVDAVAWLGNRSAALALDPPPAGVSLATAVKAGDPYRTDKGAELLYGVRITLRALEAIDGTKLSAPSVSQDTWVWLLVYSSDKFTPNGRAIVVVTLVDGRPLLGASGFP